MSGCIYIQFVNAEAAAYGNANPIYAVTQFAQSTMRAAMGEMELDEILHARAQLNTIIKGLKKNECCGVGDVVVCMLYFACSVLIFPVLLFLFCYAR